MKRGVLSKPATKAKVYVHKQAKYADVLSKIREELFTSSQLGSVYYLADSDGLPICPRKDGKVTVQQADGTQKAIIILERGGAYGPLWR